MDVDVVLTTEDGTVVGSVPRALLRRESQCYAAMLGGTRWCECSSGAVDVPSTLQGAAGLFVQYLHSLQHDSGDALLEFPSDPETVMQMCVFADRFAAAGFVRYLAKHYMDEQNVLHLASLPSFRWHAHERLLRCFEDVFSSRFLAKNVAVLLQTDLLDSLFLQSVFESDFLTADEGVVLDVAVALFRGARGRGAAAEAAAVRLLRCVRMPDIGLAQLDELRSADDPELVALMLPALCDAYAFQSHLAARSRFLHVHSRERELCDLRFGSWTELFAEGGAGSYETAVQRHHLVNLHASFTRNADLSSLCVQLHASHTFPDYVPIICTLTIDQARDEGAGEGRSRRVSETRVASLSFAHRFSDCQMPHGWPAVQLPKEAFSDAAAAGSVQWRVRCCFRFSEKPDPAEPAGKRTEGAPVPPYYAGDSGTPLCLP
eukprot:Rhum_TRINITY_DN19368_c0_g1::Rhum_TRINITY_DN19368_c0_g1_i1::g.169907::m.169907